eukprot:4516394-Pleurochrysis_carterae.AAC.1
MREARQCFNSVVDESQCSSPRPLVTSLHSCAPCLCVWRGYKKCDAHWMNANEKQHNRGAIAARAGARERIRILAKARAGAGVAAQAVRALVCV